MKKLMTLLTTVFLLSIASAGCHAGARVGPVHAGGGVAKDIDNIRYLAQNMLGRTFCPLGDAAAMPTIAFVDKFRKEFEDHLDGKPCPYAKLPEPALANA